MGKPRKENYLRPMDSIQIRLLDQRDFLDALSLLLHRAYGELGATGFRYKAVDQSVSVTRNRIANGECYVAVQDPEIVGTAVLLAPTWLPRVFQSTWRSSPWTRTLVPI